MEVELAHGGRGQSSSDRRGGYGGGGGGGGSARFGVSRHSEFRVIVRGLPSSASRQDLKNHMRKAGDVCFAEVTQGCDGTYGVVGYTNYDDMKYAIRKFDDTEFRNHRARAFIRVKKYESSQSRSPSRNRSRSRSRSLGRSKSKRIGVSYEMEMEIDDNFVIFDCKPGSNNLIFGGALIFSKTLDSIMTVGNYNLERNYKAIHSMLNNRMWMVHDRVNCTRLTYGCEKIGKPPPIPKSIIDTSLFTSSKTKLGRAAAMFGLGVQKHGSNWAYKGNLSAILTCKEIMSKLDVPVKTLNDTVHPMLYYLMQYNDQMKDEVRARYFNEAEYPSLNKIDDLPIMKLVDDVLKNREAELKKLYYELEKQKEDERIPLVYYKYEEIEGLYTYQGDKKDDDDDVEDEDSDDCDEFARTRGGGIKDQDQDDEDD